MVNVRSIAEMGAYVYLLEYNNIEGMILLSELSRRRIRSINKLIRVGKTEPVVVIRVDKDKGEKILKPPDPFCETFLLFQATSIFPNVVCPPRTSRNAQNVTAKRKLSVPSSATSPSYSNTNLMSSSRSSTPRLLGTSRRNIKTKRHRTTSSSKPYSNRRCWTNAILMKTQKVCC